MSESGFPKQSTEAREFLVVERDQCPQCGGELDTGWECIKCGYDAKPISDNRPEEI